MPKVRLKKTGRDDPLATAKEDIPGMICVDCKTCMVDIVKKKMPLRLEKTVLTSHEFKSAMTKCIHTLMKRNTTVEQIKETLLQRYPEHAKQITTAAIKSVIHGMMNNNNNKTKEQLHHHRRQAKATTVKIEYENSLFIDEAMIVITTLQGESIQAHLMCAIGSLNGLEKLSVRLDERFCGQEFVTSLLEGIDDDRREESCQIVMRASVEGVQPLFAGYKTMHTLVYFPHHVSVSNPVRKYLSQLASLLPKKPDIGHDLEHVEELFINASEKISTKDCKRWIDRYLSHC